MSQNAPGVLNSYAMLTDPATPLLHPLHTEACTPRRFRQILHPLPLPTAKKAIHVGEKKKTRWRQKQYTVATKTIHGGANDTRWGDGRNSRGL